MATAQENLNPHKPARLAMFKWGKEYADQNGGSMDFWESLDESRKRICREVLKSIEEAREEHFSERLAPRGGSHEI